MVYGIAEAIRAMFTIKGIAYICLAVYILLAVVLCLSLLVQVASKLLMQSSQSMTSGLIHVIIRKSGWCNISCP